MYNKRKFNEKKDPFSILMKKLGESENKVDKNNENTIVDKKSNVNKMPFVFVPKEIKAYKISGLKISSGESPNCISNKMKLAQI